MVRIVTKNVFSKEQPTMARAVRNDSWKQDDDKILADTVLMHIREGSTQLVAFETAAERLQRTSAACGFRWNADVRKRYESDIKQAKIQRQNLKAEKIGNNSADKAVLAEGTELFVTVSNVEEQEITQSINTTDYLDQIVNLAHIQKIQLANMAMQIRNLNEQLSEKDYEIKRLKHELDEAKVQPSEVTVNEDYQTLLQILQRARQLGAIEEGVRRKASV
jgi:prespore-specific regulator